MAIIDELGGMGWIGWWITERYTEVLSVNDRREGS